MTSTKPLIAFFGATGGCALNALVLTIKAGYPTIALARTPAKLTKLLTEKHGISQSSLSSNLQIITGSATDITAVKSLLAYNPAFILSGLGAGAKFQWSLTAPATIDQPSLCGDSAHILLTALHELKQENKLTTKPFFAVISTTGISKTRDVPWIFMPLYHVLLKVPHIDKRKMEDAGIEEALKGDSVLAGFTTVRASLLTSGTLKGTAAVRCGWERHETDTEGEAGPGPAIGYFISRADVGNWIFENLVDGQAAEWNRRLVTVTH